MRCEWLSKKLTLLLLGGALVFSGCDSNAPNKPFENPYEEMDRKHSEGLDYVYKQFQKRQIRNSKVGKAKASSPSPDEFASLINQYVEDFTKSLGADEREARSAVRLGVRIVSSPSRSEAVQEELCT